MVRLTASHRLPPQEPFTIRTTTGTEITTSTMGWTYADVDLAIGSYVAVGQGGEFQFEVVAGEAADRSTTSSPPPPATTTSTGVVMLSGDLAGDATTPTVPALAGKVNTTDPRLTDPRPPTAHTHAKADITGLDTDLAQLPTPGQKNALQGTQGTPGETNRYVTQQDPRLTDARAPTAHRHPVTDLDTTGTHDASTVLHGDWAWKPITGGGGGGYSNVTIMTPPNANAIWTNQPAIITELFGQTRHRAIIDMTGYTQARLVVNVEIPNAAAGARLFLQFSTNGTTWVALDGVSGPGVSLSAAGTIISPWVPLVAAARGDYRIRVAGQTTSVATGDPAFGSIYAQFK